MGGSGEQKRSWLCTQSHPCFELSWAQLVALTYRLYLCSVKPEKTNLSYGNTKILKKLHALSSSLFFFIVLSLCASRIPAGCCLNPLQRSFHWSVLNLKPTGYKRTPGVLWADQGATAAHLLSPRDRVRTDPTSLKKDSSLLLPFWETEKCRI